MLSLIQVPCVKVDGDFLRKRVRQYHSIKPWLIAYAAANSVHGLDGDKWLRKLESTRLRHYDPETRAQLMADFDRQLNSK